MRKSTVSSGAIDSQDLAPASENFRVSSSTERSSCRSIIDKVMDLSTPAIRVSSSTETSSCCSITDKVMNLSICLLVKSLGLFNWVSERIRKSAVPSSSSGTIDSQDLVPEIENLTETSYCCRVTDKVMSDNDLLTLILTFLPAKSLPILKPVSKQWFSIISDPIFAVNNFRQLKPKITGFFFESRSTTPGKPHLEVKYDFLLTDGGSKFVEGYPGEDTTAPWIFGNVPEPGVSGTRRECVVQISQSCNGLLCCNRQPVRHNMSTTVQPPPTFKTYIYNPTTRQCRCLPPSPFRDTAVPIRDDYFIQVCNISLVFDPVKSMDQHYQVVCMWRYDPHKNLHSSKWEKGFHQKFYFEIYSSKTNSWRKVDSPSANPFHGNGMNFSRSGVYWNGCLHWFATGQYRGYESSIYFDVDQELVKPLPASPNGVDLKVKYFGECGGHLYLVELVKSSDTHYNILKMETDYSGWKHIHKLDLECLFSLYPHFNCRATVGHSFFWGIILFLEVDETDSLSKLVMVASGKEVISYDLKEKSITQIFTYPGKYFFFCATPAEGVWGHLHHYIQSLARV